MIQFFSLVGRLVIQIAYITLGAMGVECRLIILFIDWPSILASLRKIRIRYRFDTKRTGLTNSLRDKFI